MYQKYAQKDNKYIIKNIPEKCSKIYQKYAQKYSKNMIKIISKEVANYLINTYINILPNLIFFDLKSMNFII